LSPQYTPGTRGGADPRTQEGTQSLSKRDSILKVAQEQLRSKGPTGVNARSIATELGIGPSHVFYYFPTHRQLLNGVVNHIVETNVRIVSKEVDQVSGDDTEDLVSAYVLGNLKWGRRLPEAVAVLFYGMTEIESDIELSRSVRAALLNGEQKLFQMLAIGVGAGKYRCLTAPSSCAKAIHQMLIGCLINQYILTKKEKITVYHRRIMDLFTYHMKKIK